MLRLADNWEREILLCCLLEWTSYPHCLPYCVGQSEVGSVGLRGLLRGGDRAPGLIDCLSLLAREARWVGVKPSITGRLDPHVSTAG